MARPALSARTRPRASTTSTRPRTVAAAVRVSRRERRRATTRPGRPPRRRRPRRLAGRLRADLAVDAVAQRERERDLERDDRQQRDVAVREHELACAAGWLSPPRRPRSGTRRRARSPGSAAWPGRRGAWRAAHATWTSSVLVEPNQFSSHTSAISCSRVTTRPASRASRARRSNSLRAQLDRAPVEQHAPGARRRRRARRRGRRSGAAAARVRRRTARTRATTSPTLKGLTT